MTNLITGRRPILYCALAIGLAACEAPHPMVGYRTVHVSELADVPAAPLGEIYVFRNGVGRSDAEPWGGGRAEGYSPLRSPHMVMWNESATPRVLRSVREIREGEAAGELSVQPSGVVVNAPVVKWPTGHHPRSGLREAVVRLKGVLRSRREALVLEVPSGAAFEVGGGEDTLRELRELRDRSGEAVIMRGRVEEDAPGRIFVTSVEIDEAG